MELTPGGQQPLPRSHHVAVWDPITFSMLVFGGSTGSMSLGDLWQYSWEKNQWMELHFTSFSSSGLLAPLPRQAHSAVWDSASMSMLVFGGLAVANSSQMDVRDVWNFSLLVKSWTQMALVSDSGTPSPRNGHAAVSWSKDV